MKTEYREHETFLILKDSEKYVKRLSMKDRGFLFTSLFAYSCRHEIPDFSEADSPEWFSLLFEMMTDRIDVDDQKYLERCKQNQKNGKKGGLAKASNRKRAQASASESYQPLANLANLADKDKETDTDTYSVTEAVSSDEDGYSDPERIKEAWRDLA